MTVSPSDTSLAAQLVALAERLKASGWACSILDEPVLRAEAPGLADRPALEREDRTAVVSVGDGDADTVFVNVVTRREIGPVTNLNRAVRWVKFTYGSARPDPPPVPAGLVERAAALAEQSP